MKQKLITLKREMEIYTIRIHNFNIPHSVIVRTTREKISKDIEDLNNSINQSTFINIYGTFHPLRSEYTFFSSAHVKFTQVGHILSHIVKPQRVSKN